MRSENGSLTTASIIMRIRDGRNTFIDAKRLFTVIYGFILAHLLR